MEGNGAVVVAQDVARRYGEGDTAVDALRSVSLAVSRGQLTTVMGPSGSGKSTLMHILAGLDRPTGGCDEMGGTEITTLDDTALTKLRREHIGFIFQFFVCCRCSRRRRTSCADHRRREGRQGVAGAADRVGRVEGPTDAPALGALRGQQQRRDRARAVSKPTVVFADEPTSNLDSKTGGEISSSPAGRPGRRPDDRDGHARRALRLDRGSHPVPRRRQHRQGCRALSVRGDRGDGGDRPDVSRSLADSGRGSRTFLTAFAIVPDRDRERVRAHGLDRACSTRSSRTSTAARRSITASPRSASTPPRTCRRRRVAPAQGEGPARGPGGDRRRRRHGN